VESNTLSSLKPGPLHDTSDGGLLYVPEGVTRTLDTAWVGTTIAAAEVAERGPSGDKEWPLPLVRRCGRGAEPLSGVFPPTDRGATAAGGAKAAVYPTCGGVFVPSALEAAAARAAVAAAVAGGDAILMACVRRMSVLLTPGANDLEALNACAGNKIDGHNH